ncbi:MAG: arsenate reductase/protein-tyrosine-phosphatase family protein [Syntrophales bacterium]
MNILFVCSANIVRSFMAERLLRNLLRSRGRQEVGVSSAGLLDMKEAPGDEVARQILAENGIDDEGHVSRQVTEEMVGAADLIVTMEKRQLLCIGDRYPEAVPKLRLLKSYLDGGTAETADDVSDPYRRSLFYYRLCFAEISLAVGAMSKCI